MGKDLKILLEFSEVTLQHKALSVPFLHKAAVLVIQVLQEDLKEDHGQGWIPCSTIPEKHK